ncbi:MAG TPA: 50S ribosomal protein L17 [Balneolales bacterium]|nr:50S ribosomal protein L17 [Balneolales bacterium]
MRHLKAGKGLSRTASHKKATMRALSVALINNRRIVTTLAKAKELRRYFEPLVTKAKKDNSHTRRQIFSFLRDKKAVSLMFDEVAPVVGDRPGGYTRIIKVGTRAGDGAETALIELVDFNDVKPETKSKRKKRTRRGSGGGKKSIKGIKETKETAPEKSEKPKKAKEEKAQAKSEEGEETKKATAEAKTKTVKEEKEAESAKPEEKDVEDKDQDNSESKEEKDDKE